MTSYVLSTSLVAQTVKCLPTMQGTQVQSLSQEDLLEKEMATHSSILGWEVPLTEEPGGLQSMGLQRDMIKLLTLSLSLCILWTLDLSSAPWLRSHHGVPQIPWGWGGTSLPVVLSTAWQGKGSITMYTEGGNREACPDAMKRWNSASWMLASCVSNIFPHPYKSCPLPFLQIG